MNQKEVLILNYRLKEVRKLIGDTQTEFAEKLGTSRNAIASYELSKVIPNDTFIQLLCAKFNINENWLRTGEGDMTLPLSREEEIMQFIGKVQGADNAVAKRILSLMAKLDDSDWVTIDKILDILVADTKKEGSSN